MTDSIVIVGAGPSGLTAAHEAARHGASTTIVERLNTVGGLARTIEFHGNRFDIGPHRFFTKNVEVAALYASVLGGELLKVPRVTRILHEGRYFDYPLTPANAILGLGLGEAAGVAGSFAAAKIRALAAPRPITNFEDWAIDRFGDRLYQRFFKPYTEKVWGLPCHQISADWASQRIRGLSLAAALRNMLWSSDGSAPRTLADEFAYPRLGAGQTYEMMAAAVEQRGGRLLTGADVQSIRREGMRVRAIVTTDGSGQRQSIEGRFFLISAPITDAVEMMEPLPPAEVLAACRALRYRDHIAVNLVVEGRPFADNWIYVHDNSVAIARIASYRNFSPEMAAGPDISPITVEYFSSPGDELSLVSDDMVIERAKTELAKIGIATADQAKASFVVRSSKAYPISEIGAEAHVRTIKAWVGGFENLLPIGRCGTFKYNNQDHAMATGLIAARTALGLQRADPWSVNIDAEYQELALSS